MSLISRINDLASRIATEIKLKQDKLLSGTNIKTINNESILGSGNITVQGSGESDGVTRTEVGDPSMDYVPIFEAEL